MISFLISVVTDFVEIVSNKYKALMMKLALQITGNSEDAEEAFQNALFSVHRNQHKIDDVNSDKARNYIYTVTKNAAIKIRNQQSKFDKDVTYSDYEGLIGIEGQVDIDTFRDEYGFSEYVSNALKELSNNDRDLICYYYGVGYTYKEISELMDVDARALRKRMERIKTKLADILQSENR
mgnify:CR=1 FL=1